jgi:hypothetical protein
VRFTLTFDGELHSTGNGSRKRMRKWEVRKHFDPQLRELWTLHPALIELMWRRYWPRAGGWYIEGHHSTDHSREPILINDDDIDLLSVQELGGRKFFPLIRHYY